ncbi:MAG: TonB-dependent receptor [Acidobacteriota bacterium]
MISPLRLTLYLVSLLSVTVPTGIMECLAAECVQIRYQGLSLVAALENLRACGLNLLYSSDRVRADMMVLTEPTGGSPLLILKELLAAHGLEAIDGPGGRLLIVDIAGAAVMTGTIKGRLTSEPNHLPVPLARLRLAGLRREATTSREGSFRFDGVPEGAYTLELFHGDTLLEQFDTINVEANKSTEIEIETSSKIFYIEELIVTPNRYEMGQDQPAPKETLSSAALQEIPSVGGDLHRSVSHLPGLASGDRSAQFSIRGGNADEVLFILDGMEILDPYHLKAFQNFSGIIDSRAIGRADVLTGGFPAEYGDRMSGVVDLSSNPVSGNGQTILGANVINAHLLSNGRFANGDGQWLLSARSWHPDAVFDLVEPNEEDIGPKYTDFMARTQFRVGDSTTLSGNFLMGHDKADYEFKDSDEFNERVRVRSDSKYGWIGLDSAWTSRFFSRTLLSVGQINTQREGATEPAEETPTRVRDERSFDVYGFKQDWGYRASESAFFKFGFEAKRLKGAYDYFAEAPPDISPLEPDSESPAVVRELSVDPTGDEFGAFLSGRFRISEPLTAELGVRWDRQSHTSEDQISPRINILYNIGDRSAIRVGWGRFYQSQGINELQVEDGISDFHPTQLSEHRIISFEHNFISGLHLKLNAYSKKISDPRPRYENLFDPFELFPEASGDRVLIAPDRAEASGIEVFLKSKSGTRFSWWANYALASVEDEIDGEWVPRSWDQRHAFNFGLNLRPNPKWTINLAGIYHSGWPTTAVGAEVVEDEDGLLEAELFLGPRNAERFSDYYRLDTKVSRHIPLKTGRLTFYVEVLNVFNQLNPCCVDDVDAELRPDGSVRVIRDEEYGLERLPTFGIIWEIRH